MDAEEEILDLAEFISSRPSSAETAPRFDSFFPKRACLGDGDGNPQEKSKDKGMTVLEQMVAKMTPEAAEAKSAEIRERIAAYKRSRQEFEKNCLLK